MPNYPISDEAVEAAKKARSDAEWEGVRNELALQQASIQAFLEAEAKNGNEMTHWVERQRRRIVLPVSGQAVEIVARALRHGHPHDGSDQDEAVDQDARRLIEEVFVAEGFEVERSAVRVDDYTNEAAVVVREAPLRAVRRYISKWRPDDR